LKTILQKLGIQNTYTSNQIIQRKIIEEMMNYLQENRSSIHMSFGLKDHSKAKAVKYEQCIKLINKVCIIGLILN